MAEQVPRDGPNLCAVRARLSLGRFHAPHVLGKRARGHRQLGGLDLDMCGGRAGPHRTERIPVMRSQPAVAGGRHSPVVSFEDYVVAGALGVPSPTHHVG